MEPTDPQTENQNEGQSPQQSQDAPQEKPQSPVADAVEPTEPHHDITPIEPEDSAKTDGLAQGENTAPAKQSRNWFGGHKKLVISAIVILVVIAGSITTFALTRKKATTNDGTDSKKSTQKTEANFSYTFLDEAKDVEPVKLFKDLSFGGQSCEGENYDKKCKDLIKDTDIEYQQVGTVENDGKLVSIIINNGIDSAQLLVKQTDDTVTILAKAIPSYGYVILDKSGSVSKDSSVVKSLHDDVTIDTTTTFKELEFPMELEVNGQKIHNKDGSTTGYFVSGGLSGIRGIGYGGGTVDTNKITKLGEKDGKTYYQVVTKEEPTYSVKAFYGMYKGIVAHTYYQNGEIASAKDALAITWTAGENNKSKYFSAGSGCGSPTGFVVANSNVKAQLVQVGTSAGGQKIYQLPNGDALVTELYNKDYAGGSMLLDTSPYKNLTIQQFTDNHAYFLVENGLGEYVVFLRDDFIVRGGCAKPVVYLYPTTPTKVNVAVGADVTISDPLYPSGGWKNVLAQPNGQLTYNGKQYGSLFWEGYGHGEYPDITFGTVVARKDAPATIRAQLKQQGLNTQEISDFMEFWESRLPNTPYVRLSWLSKTQIDRLAPLTISPAPQTTIRVFLDFEGLSQPITLPAQKLATPKRAGFTAVEWGGLLRNGLHAQ